MPRFFLVLALLLSAAAVTAQPVEAPRVPDAETAFEGGLDAYRTGAYAEARRLFQRAASEFGYNERTTAALLMAGKAAYAAGDVDGARGLLTGLVTQYPSSRYGDEARRVLGLLDGAPPEAFDLGVILPATGESAYLAQAMFNGVRLAVDDHNEAHPDRPVHLVFRDSEGSPDGARTALGLAARAGADAVIGPLFSGEAVAAAEVAEREGIVLIAPLATDEAVADGRTFVFQANPTFPVRGRAMARYIVGEGHRRLATIAVTGTFGERMAAAFEEEATRLGATFTTRTRLDAEADWDALPVRVGPSRLQGAEAVYLPITGDDAPEHVADALRGLEAMGVELQALGNTEWEGLDASRARAARYRAVFDQDFNVSDDAAEFAARYRALAGVRADRLALMGYDATTFLLREAVPEGGGVVRGTALAERLRAAGVHRGLAHRIAFEGGQVNSALFLMTFRGGEAVLVE
ncbi:MAG TPA: penicillin-binding protein activator [Rhodothermales bacterium]|nr:penicillin-binding protein activator [Rhodothermales bacterium]